MRPNGELPSDHHADRRKAHLLSIVPPRAQGSRRCETQASLRRQAAKAPLAFRSLDPFRALREPDCRRRDEKRPFPLRTKNFTTTQNNRLTGKAPYKSANFRFLISRERPESASVECRFCFDCAQFFGAPLMSGEWAKLEDTGAKDLDA